MYLCNEQITIYNRYTNKEKLKEYVPTVITGVHWFGTEKVSVTSDGLVGATQYTIRIPVEADFDGKAYVSPKTYQNELGQGKIFTLCEGDIIVKGLATETGAEAKPSKLQAKYDDVVTVVSITDSTNVPNGKHWKVVCK